MRLHAGRPREAARRGTAWRVWSCCQHTAAAVQHGTRRCGGQDRHAAAAAADKEEEEEDGRTLHVVPGAAAACWIWREAAYLGLLAGLPAQTGQALRRCRCRGRGPGPVQEKVRVPPQQAHLRVCHRRAGWLLRVDT